MGADSKAAFRAALFIVLVLSISWTFGVYVFARPDRLWLFNRVMFVPGLVALIMRFSEKQGIREVWAPLIARLDLQGIAFSVLYPLSVITACALVAVATGLARADVPSFGKLMPHITVFAVLVVMGEEYGWRGYLLPRLSAWKGQRVATIVVGLVWAIWHGPFLFWLATRLNTDEPVKLCLIQMSAIFVIAFPFSYAYFRSSSIVPPMILHYVWNEYNPIVLGNIYRNQPGLLIGNILTINGEGILGVAIGSVAALWFVRKMSDSGTINKVTILRPTIFPP